MNSALRSRLTDEEFLAMEKYASERLESVDATMTSWRNDRKVYEAQMQDDFEWRRGGNPDVPNAPQDIFEEHNDSLNLSAAFAEYTAAKARDDIFGSSPFYAAVPEGQDDKVFAKRLQKHSEWKVRRSTFEQACLDAIPLATGLGETVLKVRWRDESDEYEARRKVLVDARTDKPVVTQAGEYIFSDDEMVTVDPAGNEYPAGESVPVPEGVNPKKFAASLRTFARKAPETPIGPIKWRDMFVPETIVRYRNVDAYNVDFRNLIAPLNVRSLEEGVDTSIVGQLFDLPLLDMRAQLERNGDKIPPEVFGLLQSGDTTPKAEGTTAPKEGSAEIAEARNDDQTQRNPNIQWAEVYFSYFLPNGKKIRVFGILAREAKKLVYVEYLGLVTPKGRLPLFVVRVFGVKNRWYGRGYFEIFALAQDYIDRNLNYVGQGNSTHRVAAKFVQKDAIEILDDTEEWELDPRKVEYLKTGKKATDALQLVELPDLDGRTMDLMRLMIQVAQARAGITGPGQAAVSELPQNGTATGVEALISVGQVLGKVPISGISEGIEQALEFAILTIYDHFDAEETFVYEEGNRTLTDRMTPDQVRNLDLDVRLILTRFRQREQRENAQNAAAAVLQYLTEVPDPYKKAVRPFYVQIVNGYGFDEAEQAVPEPVEPALPTGPTGEPLPPEQQAVAAL